MRKQTLYLLGLATLILFPLPAFLVLYYFEGQNPWQVLDLVNLGWKQVGVGLLFGGLYGFFALYLMKSRVFDSLPNHIEKIVRAMRLNIFDCVFISFCAGFGEELLFRAGVQFYIGPLVTSVLFVAIHGYLNPFNWKMSLYGLIVLPFILLISYGLPYLGLWFCIAAHFCYDFVLFVAMSTGEPIVPQSEDELFVEPTDTEEEQ